MAEHPRFIGLIPARGGSKRLPRKNALLLAGKPLLAWTSMAAQAAQHLDRVILSTDNAELAEIGRAHGADVPFIRPAKLAGDAATSLGVIQHTLHWLREHGEHYDYLVMLQPTSPLRTALDIDNAIKLLLKKNADAVISVCETDHPPEWSNQLPDDGAMNHFFRPGIRNTRSQDLPKSYRLNGAVYIYNCARLLKTGSLAMDDNSYAYVMPRERSVDIDSAIDFEIAQLFMQRIATDSST